MSMPRPTVKRHTIFWHPCPNPALLSTACAIVININKTEKTEDCRVLRRLVRPPYYLVLFHICYGNKSCLRIIHLKIQRFQDLWYVTPPFEQCYTSSTSSDVVPLRCASYAFSANGGMFSRTLQMFKHRFLCVIFPELLHSYHSCNVESFFTTDQKF